MTPINLDMIKQLLQEFVDKEAVTTAEINVVQQQVQELEARITKCRDKLQVISTDKDKIVSMTKRYTEATALSPVQANSAATSAPAKPKKTAIKISEPDLVPAATVVPEVAFTANEQAKTLKDPLAPQAVDQESSQTITGDHPVVQASPSLNFQASKSVTNEAAVPSKSASDTQNNLPALKPAEPELTAQAPEASGEGEEDKSDAKKVESLKESVDDTVKSINDALRGLFR